MLDLRLPRIVKRPTPSTRRSAGFMGVLADDAGDLLHRAGVEPVFVDGGIAFGRAVRDAASPCFSAPKHGTSERFVVAGDILIDNTADLRRALGLGDVDDATLFAELFALYGIDAGRQALGMYAVAVWDRQ